MDRSGRGRRCIYGPCSAGSQTSSEYMDKRDASRFVSSYADWKSKPLHFAAPRPDTDDGEEYISGLVEEIPHSMLEESKEGWSLSNGTSLKLSESVWGSQVLLSTSPQSTLAGMSSWDLLSPGASSNGGLSSGVASPSSPVESKGEEDALDLLYAELLRLKMEDEIKVRQQQLMRFKQEQHYQQLLWNMRQRHLSSVESLEVSKTPHYHEKSGFYRNKLTSEQVQSQSRSTPFQNIMSSKQLSRGRGSRSRGRVSWTSVASASPAVVDQGSSCCEQVNYGSGMRAVFLGVPGARECGGTGVFLPRRIGNGHDSKRKPACSTVLLPSHIVQALNLNVGPVNSPSSVCLRQDMSSHVRSGELVDDNRGACSSLQEVAPNVCLPTEWTY